jgi:hypothetical protein
LRPADPAANLAGREIEASFARPRELEARTRSGTRIVLPDVRGVRGRALEIRNDTLILEISWWRRSAAWQREPSPAVAPLRLSDPATRIGQRRLSPGRTLAMIVVTPAVLFAFAFILYIAGGGTAGT